MPTAREGMAALAVGRRLFVIGGCKGDDYSRAVESLHMEKLIWESLACAPAPIKGDCSAVVHGGRIFVFGGYPGDGSESDWTAEAVKRYRPETDSWEAMPGMAVPRRGFATAAIDDSLFAVGGYTDHRVCGDTESIELKPLRCGWSTTPALPYDVGYAAAATIKFPRCRIAK